jgi:hypothetical protein
VIRTADWRKGGDKDQAPRTGCLGSRELVEGGGGHGTGRDLQLGGGDVGEVAAGGTREVGKDAAGNMAAGWPAAGGAWRRVGRGDSWISDGVREPGTAERRRGGQVRRRTEARRGGARPAAGGAGGAGVSMGRNMRLCGWGRKALVVVVVFFSKQRIISRQFFTVRDYLLIEVGDV